MEVSFAAAAGCCETLEGVVAYQAGDALLTGLRGERWPVARRSFETGYAAIPPTRAGEAGRYVKRPVAAVARRMSAPFTVKVGWRDDPLRGQAGDWLLRYADGTYGIVADAIFRESYERVP